MGTEQVRLDFRGEFFNIVNHAQFMAPDGNISDGADFGRVMLAQVPRSIQFAPKLFSDAICRLGKQAIVMGRMTNRKIPFKSLPEIADQLGGSVAILHRQDAGESDRQQPPRKVISMSRTLPGSCTFL